jgi:lambda family phage portal protein
MSNFLDSIISYFNPSAALQRASARAALANLQDIGGRSSLSSYDSFARDRLTAQERAYIEAGKRSRLNSEFQLGSQCGDPPLDEVQISRLRAHHAFINNALANKAVRSIISRIIGYGLTPESDALFPDGSVNTPFRNATNKLWNAWKSECCITGAPGRGGMSFDELLCMAVGEMIVSGESITRHTVLMEAEAAKLGIEVPLQLQVMEAERLCEYETGAIQQTADAPDATICFRGIELNKNGRRVAYRIQDLSSQLLNGLPFGGAKFVTVPASEILHLYTKQRPNSLRGITWFAPVLNKLKFIDDYMHNELVASTVAACLVMTIKQKPTSPTLGLTPSAANDNAGTDTNGNREHVIEPGSLWRLNPDEEADAFNPARPNSDAEAFLSLATRMCAVGMRGLKTSSLTGDYRNSSFSSEKSNEAELHFEIKAMQNFVVDNFCKPIFAKFVETAILSRAYDQFPDVEVPDWKDLTPAKQQQLFASTWQGPGSYSLDPVKEAQASQLEIAAGTSSMIKECQKAGVNFLSVLDDTQRIIEECDSRGLPEEYKLRMIGGKEAPAATPDKQQPPGNDQSQKQ